MSEPGLERSRLHIALLFAAAISIGIIIAFVVGMLSHPGHKPTIVHSWAAFYSWAINSNISGLLAGALIPTLPLAGIAEAHHRTQRRHMLLLHEKLDHHADALQSLHDHVVALVGTPLDPSPVQEGDNAPKG